MYLASLVVYNARLKGVSLPPVGGGRVTQLQLLKYHETVLVDVKRLVGVV